MVSSTIQTSFSTNIYPLDCFSVGANVGEPLLVLLINFIIMKESYHFEDRHLQFRLDQVNIENFYLFEAFKADLAKATFLVKKLGS